MSKKKEYLIDEKILVEFLEANHEQLKKVDWENKKTGNSFFIIQFDMKNKGQNWYRYMQDVLKWGEDEKPEEIFKAHLWDLTDIEDMEFDCDNGYGDFQRFIELPNNYSLEMFYNEAVKVIRKMLKDKR